MQTGKHKIKQKQLPFQMHISPIFGEVISRHGVRPDPGELKLLMEMALKTKK